MSSTLVLAGLVEPRYAHFPESVRTDGDEVAGLNADAGYAPDGEQRMLLDGIFAKDAAGKSAAFACAILGCRQNIKTSTEKMACNGWLFLYHCNPIIWTGHEWDTVDEHFLDIVKIIEGDPWLDRQIKSVKNADRDKEIVTKRGGRMIFKTRTPDGGTGLTGEKVVLDDAWKVRHKHVSSLMPTLSARTMTGDPQVIYGSSAAHADSDVLHALVRRGRKAAGSAAGAARERKFMYVEWCAPPPAAGVREGRGLRA